MNDIKSIGARHRNIVEIFNKLQSEVGYPDIFQHFKRLLNMKINFHWKKIPLLYYSIGLIFGYHKICILDRKCIRFYMNKEINSVCRWFFFIRSGSNSGHFFFDDDDDEMDFMILFSVKLNHIEVCSVEMSMI